MESCAAPLTPRALRTRWALAGLRSAAAAADEGAWPQRTVTAMGLVFPGPVVLAAGFDRHGALAGTAHRLGLGAVETGTFLGAAQARRGAARLRTAGDRRAVLGASIGKHPATPWSQAEGEFTAGFLAVHRQVDYLTLNPGRSPVTPEAFALALGAVRTVRDRLAAGGTRRLPLVAKIPTTWLAGRRFVHACAAMVEAGASGLLISAEGCSSREARAGLRELTRALGDGVCLISVGGIRDLAEARARIEAGARLVQVHRALTAEGPRVIRHLAHGLARWNARALVARLRQPPASSALPTISQAYITLASEKLRPLSSSHHKANPPPARPR